MHLDCSESFYKQCVEEELKSQERDPKDQRKMIDILKRLHDDDMDNFLYSDTDDENNVSPVDSDDDNDVSQPLCKNQILKSFPLGSRFGR